MDAPAPIPTPHDAPFWAAAKEGRLLLQRCGKSGRFQFYPRNHSLFDPAGDLEWTEASGRGHVFTYTVVHRAFYDNVPRGTILAVVELEEGVKLTGHLIATPEDVRIGMPVRVGFTGGETPLIQFHPEA